MWGRVKREILIVVPEKEMVPRCSLQLASEIRPSTPSTEQRSDGFLKYVVQRERMEERSQSIRGAGKEGKFVKKVTADMFLRRRLKQTLSDMVEVESGRHEREFFTAFVRLDFKTDKAGG